MKLDFGAIYAEANGRSGDMIAVVHREEKFEEVMEQFQQKRAEFIAQEIRFFDAKTLYCLIGMFKASGHKFEEMTGMAV